MTQTFLDTPVETFPLGVAKIQVQDGHWTFNNKKLKDCKFPVQQMVEAFIRTCAFRKEVEEIKTRTGSYSVIATKQTINAHSHLKAHNYEFPSIEEETVTKLIEAPTMDMFPEFIPKTN